MGRAAPHPPLSRWSLVVLSATSVDPPRVRTTGSDLAALVFGGACIAAQWIAFGTAAIWLPGIPLLAAVLAMVVVAGLIRRRIPAPKVVPVAAPAPEIPTPPAPEPEGDEGEPVPVKKEEA